MSNTSVLISAYVAAVDEQNAAQAAFDAAADRLERARFTRQDVWRGVAHARNEGMLSSGIHLVDKRRAMHITQVGDYPEIVAIIVADTPLA